KLALREQSYQLIHHRVTTGSASRSYQAFHGCSLAGTATFRAMKLRLALPGPVLALLFAARAQAATYYVAPAGSDSAAGREGAPWASMSKAQSVAAAGDTIYFRGGTYAFTAGTSSCSSETATINAIQLNKSGSAGKPISYFAYAGEKPVFDFSGI